MVDTDISAATKKENNNKNLRLEELVKKENKIIDTWRLYFQPGSILRYLNIERQISKLDPSEDAPNYKDWMIATGFEMTRIGLYAFPILKIGVKLYR
jgi:hypothetical protein